MTLLKLPLVLRDVLGKNWTLDKFMGQGGFASVYSATGSDITENVVVKIFKTKQSYTTELFCYQNICTATQIAKFKEKRRLGHLGIPKFHAHGSHSYNDKKTKTIYFIVFQKLYPVKQLLNELFRENNLVMMCVQILDVLEFFHVNGWTHNDIKYDNILMDHHRNFYLIDYGLITSYLDAVEGLAVEGGGGTVKYMSLDVHRGYTNSPRGDLLNLVFMLKILLTCPWNLDNKAFSVETNILIEKETFVAEPDCKNFTAFAREIIRYQYKDKPNYQLLKKLLPTQQPISAVKAIYEQYVGRKQTAWFFSVVFQTQILPYLYRLNKKLNAIKSLKKTRKLFFTDLQNIIEPIEQNIILDVAALDFSIYTEVNLCDASVAYINYICTVWVIYLAKRTKKLLTQTNESLSCTILNLTKQLSNLNY